MALGIYSEAEKAFVLHGVEANFRYDGRTREEFRPMEVETNIVPHANGSARLRLANTDILVGVKAEICKPSSINPDEGLLEFFVDCSAIATPAFEGRGGEDVANEISSALSRAYSSSHCFDKKCLCILPRLQCWKLYVDILILECGGNLFDAVGLCVKSALKTTLVPRVASADVDGENADLVLSDDPEDCWKLNVDNAPLLINIFKVGENCVVDPGAEEEAVGGGGLVIAYSAGKFTTVLKLGDGSLHINTIKEALKMAASVGKTLEVALHDVLDIEDRMGSRKEIAGFLK